MTLVLMWHYYRGKLWVDSQLTLKNYWERTATTHFTKKRSYPSFYFNANGNILIKIKVLNFPFFLHYIYKVLLSIIVLMRYISPFINVFLCFHTVCSMGNHSRMRECRCPKPTLCSSLRFSCIWSRFSTNFCVISWEI